MLRDVLERLASDRDGAVLNFDRGNNDPELVVGSSDLYDVAKDLKADTAASFDFLSFVTGVDYADHIEVVYFLSSIKHGHRMFLKTRVPRDNGEVKSVVSIWETADFHERETYDLYGVTFSEHPNLSRIFLTKDFPGHPFKKDAPFVNDEEYLLKEGYSEVEDD